jgi:nucleoid DNA-binding protein
VRETLFELIQVFRDDEAVVPDIPTILDREGIGLVRFLFNREIDEIEGLIFNRCGIALHGDTLFRKELNFMRASLRGRDELTATVQQALALATKKEADHVINAVIGGLEATLLSNLGADGFTLKLGSFGKFSVRHKPGILKKIPFTGETIRTKDKRKVRFASLGSLRQREAVG